MQMNAVAAARNGTSKVLGCREVLERPSDAGRGQSPASSYMYVPNRLSQQDLRQTLQLWEKELHIRKNGTQTLSSRIECTVPCSSKLCLVLNNFPSDEALHIELEPRTPMNYAHYIPLFLVRNFEVAVGVEACSPSSMSSDDLSKAVLAG